MPAPEPAAVPAPILRSRVPFLVGCVAMGVALLGTIVALYVHNGTFVEAYVVDVSGRGIVGILADGKDESGPKLERAGDVGYARFTLRRARGRTHEVVVTDRAGGRQTFALDDAADGRSGWVIAPEAEARDLCFVDSEVLYGTAFLGAQQGWEVLKPDPASAAILPVRHVFDHVFEAAPTTIKTDRSSERKRTLRAYVCSELAQNRAVVYRERRR